MWQAQKLRIKLSEMRANSKKKGKNSKEARKLKRKKNVQQITCAAALIDIFFTRHAQFAYHNFGSGQLILGS